MDLLLNAYSTNTDEDEENETHPPPPFKRAKREFTHTSNHISTESSIAGRYISKRERALMASSPQSSNPVPPSSSPSSPVQGSISDSDIRKDILSLLKNQTNSSYTSERNTNTTALIGHTKAVNALQWSKTHPHLLASCGMDSSIHIWNVWNTEKKKARVLNIHTAAVKDIKWSDSNQSLSLLSCGYDSTSRLIDVEKGVQIRVFNEDQVVGAVRFHPNNCNLFLSGGSKGVIRLWDIRSGNAVNQYVRGLGPILDLEFMNDTKRFISSSDESKSNLSENSIVVWDVSREVPLSNQIYVEAYTCPSIRHHPYDPYFIAQSNGNYIAIFSSKSPFKLDKYKRYESHSVSGFPIKCNFSTDGKKLASASSNGFIYIYNTKTCHLIKKLKLFEQASIDVAFHPVLSNVIASCSWNGEISVSELSNII